MSGLLGKASDARELLVSMIIRPPRAKYELSELGLQQFMLYGHAFERIDLDLTNARGLVLKCSHFIPLPRKPGPCVVYLHGNCGCRLDGCNAVPLLGPSGIQVFCFDFSGSGLSDGEYISLGVFEKEDVTTVVEYLRKSELVTTIGLWGRSMGAATALMYAADDPSIAGMVVDSPFADLRLLARELVDSPQLPVSVPKSAIDLGMKLMRKTVKKQAKFDINHLKPIDYVERCFSPCLFAHGEEDNFIQPHHSQDLYALYGGEKSITLLAGQDHNSARPSYFRDVVGLFFANALLALDDVVSPIPAVDPMAGHELGVSLGCPSAPAEAVPGAAVREIADAPNAAALLHGVLAASEGADVNMNGVDEDEEEMIRRAIELSLMDMQGGSDEASREVELPAVNSSAREEMGGGGSKKESRERRKGKKKRSKERPESDRADDEFAAGASKRKHRHRHRGRKEEKKEKKERKEKEENMEEEEKKEKKHKREKKKRREEKEKEEKREKKGKREKREKREKRDKEREEKEEGDGGRESKRKHKKHEAQEVLDGEP